MQTKKPDLAQLRKLADEHTDLAKLLRSWRREMPRNKINLLDYASQLEAALLFEVAANWSVTVEKNQIVITLEQGPRGIKLQLVPDTRGYGSPESWGRRLAHRMMAVLNGDMSNVTEVEVSNATTS